MTEEVIKLTNVVSKRLSPGRRRRWFQRPSTRSSAAIRVFVVFVMPAEPRPHRAVFVAAIRRPVEDCVVAHQELRSACVAGVAKVNAISFARENADAMPLGDIAGDIRAATAGVWATIGGRFSRNPESSSRRNIATSLDSSANVTSFEASASDTPKSKLKSLS